MQITSQANQHLKLSRRVRDGREPSLIFVEGQRLIAECLDADLPLIAAFHRLALEERSRHLVLALRKRDCPVYELDDSLMRTLSDTVSSQGLVLLAQRPEVASRQMLTTGNPPNQSTLIVALDRVQDPGNAGTIVRTAEAAGATGLITLAGTVDPFSPKSLRASMGSAFRLPIACGVSLDSILTLSHEHDVTVVGTVAEAKLDYTAYDWRGPTLVVLGNEAGGVAAALLARCQVTIRIPVASPVESLNVAAAAAVVLFEAARQRRSSESGNSEGRVSVF